MQCDVCEVVVGICVTIDESAEYAGIIQPESNNAIGIKNNGNTVLKNAGTNGTPI